MTSDFSVLERYETGLAKLLLMNGVEFLWDDWVLCQISWWGTNPAHWCIASSFRGDSIDDLTVTIMNPTYEKMRDFVKVKSLTIFKLIRVIEEVRSTVNWSFDASAPSQ